ncbi:MAG: DUF3493 domain-containing protein [Gloeomargaritaceae cyanobacterium C42_A2020_066]|nr:DUF3493 domain-containing protein [Gloeomargaritaceae cyanobacterium C42_A2020_066]
MTGRPDPDYLTRLKAEAAAPYRRLRQFIYVAFGASGFLGAVVFLSDLAAGRGSGTTLGNFALQVGLVALMVALYRWDAAAGRQQVERLRRK